LRRFLSPSPAPDRVSYYPKQLGVVVHKEGKLSNNRTSSAISITSVNSTSEVVKVRRDPAG